MKLIERTRKLKTLGIEKEDRRYLNERATGFCARLLWNDKMISDGINHCINYGITGKDAYDMINKKIRGKREILSDLLDSLTDYKQRQLLRRPGGF